MIQYSLPSSIERTWWTSIQHKTEKVKEQRLLSKRETERKAPYLGEDKRKKNRDEMKSAQYWSSSCKLHSKQLGAWIDTFMMFLLIGWIAFGIVWSLNRYIDEVSTYRVVWSFGFLFYRVYWALLPSWGFFGICAFLRTPPLKWWLLDGWKDEWTVILDMN